MTISESSKAEKGWFGCVIDDAFEVQFCLVVEIHGHVKLPSEAHCLLEHLILADALVDSFQTLADVS